MKKDHQAEYSYGFGTVVELKDKPRRKPFVAKKYVKSLKRQVSVGTAATREDAVALLLDSRENPGKYNPTGLSFAEVYAIACHEHIQHLEEKRRKVTELHTNTAPNYTAAFSPISLFMTCKILSVTSATKVTAVLRRKRLKPYYGTCISTPLSMALLRQIKTLHRT